MDGYLGEFPIEIENSRFRDYQKSDWIFYYVEKYGQIQGEHHKTWVLDQIARILNDTPILLSIAKWDNGYEEYRVSLGEPSPRYLNWVAVMEQEEYEYDTGIAP